MLRRQCPYLLIARSGFDSRNPVCPKPVEWFWIEWRKIRLCTFTSRPIELRLFCCFNYRCLSLPPLPNQFIMRLVNKIVVQLERLHSNSNQSSADTTSHLNNICFYNYCTATKKNGHIL